MNRLRQLYYRLVLGHYRLGSCFSCLACYNKSCSYIWLFTFDILNAHTVEYYRIELPARYRSIWFLLLHRPKETSTTTISPFICFVFNVVKINTLWYTWWLQVPARMGWLVYNWLIWAFSTDFACFTFHRSRFYIFSCWRICMKNNRRRSSC